MFSKTSSKAGWMLFGMCFFSVAVAYGDGWGREEDIKALLWLIGAALYGVLSTFFLAIFRFREKTSLSVMSAVGVFIYMMCGLSGGFQDSWHPFYIVPGVGMISTAIYFLLFLLPEKVKAPSEPPSEEV